VVASGDNSGLLVLGAITALCVLLAVFPGLNPDVLGYFADKQSKRTGTRIIASAVAVVMGALFLFVWLKPIG
jgi:hypothetical protein